MDRNFLVSVFSLGLVSALSSALCSAQANFPSGVAHQPHQGEVSVSAATRVTGRAA
jgi:hypothetical protein